MSLKEEKMKQDIPATTILKEILSKYASEMIDYENSISFAIYEFYSNAAISKEGNSVKNNMKFQKLQGATANPLIAPKNYKKLPL